MYPVSLTQSYFPAFASGAIEPMTIGDVLRRRAQEHAQTIALKEIGYDGTIGRIWTYAELRDDAERLGRALASRHAPGARIAVYANNSAEWVLLEFASAMAGLTLVTVNPAFQTRELKYVVEQSRSEAIYYVAEFRGSAMKATVAEVCSEVAAVQHCILLTDHDALLDGEESGVLPPVDSADVTQIQYTSGTTGFPKGALLHHHGLIQNARDIMARSGLGAGETYLHIVPLFHTTGCAINVLGVICAGATILLAPMFDPEMLVRVIERERPTFMLGVPTMLVGLVDEALRSGRDVSSFKGIMSGGAMVAPELIARVKSRIRANGPDPLRADRMFAGHHHGVEGRLACGSDWYHWPAVAEHRRRHPRYPTPRQCSRSGTREKSAPAAIM